MLSDPLAKIAAFAVSLLLVFGAAFALGGALEPSPPAQGERALPHREAGAGGASSHGATAPHGASAGTAPHGASHGQEGPRLRVDSTQPLRFRVVWPDGSALREFDVTHTKRMHAIVVRDDLSSFRHLHPRLAPDGTWAADLRLPERGAHTLFADFSSGGEALTLDAPLPGGGASAPRPLPAPRPVAHAAGGFEVRLAPVVARPGEEVELAFDVRRGGRPADIQPYLGAGGHLVALREGDLEFLHVHPLRGTVFATTFPASGSYRLFLQFKVDGEVRTVAFTKEVS